MSPSLSLLWFYISATSTIRTSPPAAWAAERFIYPAVRIMGFRMPTAVQSRGSLSRAAVVDMFPTRSLASGRTARGAHRLNPSPAVEVDRDASGRPHYPALCRGLVTKNRTLASPVRSFWLFFREATNFLDPLHASPRFTSKCIYLAHQIPCFRGSMQIRTAWPNSFTRLKLEGFVPACCS